MRHGDMLTVVTVVDDPIYLEEPFIRSTNWVLNPDAGNRPHPVRRRRRGCGQPKGYVPHYLPGSPGATAQADGVRGQASSSRAAGARRRGDDVSGVPGQTAALMSRRRQHRERGPTSVTDAVAPTDSDCRVHGARPGQRLHARRRRRQHHRADRRRRRPAGRSGIARRERRGARRHSARSPTSRSASSSTRTSTPITSAATRPSRRPADGSAATRPATPASPSTGARVIAHERVLRRMSAPTGQQAPLPFAAWPTETFFGADKEIFFNNEAIQIIHQPAAHTDGDIIVFFRRSDVVSAGDLFVTTTYPVIDARSGGSVQGVIDGLNRIIDITIPKDKEEGGTYVIPGHGGLADEADVVEYRDMVTIVRDRDSGLSRRARRSRRSRRRSRPSTTTDATGRRRVHRGSLPRPDAVGNASASRKSFGFSCLRGVSAAGQDCSTARAKEG